MELKLQCIPRVHDIGPWGVPLPPDFTTSSPNISKENQKVAHLTCDHYDGGFGQDEASDEEVVHALGVVDAALQLLAREVGGDVVDAWALQCGMTEAEEVWRTTEAGERMRADVEADGGTRGGTKLWEIREKGGPERGEGREEARRKREGETSAEVAGRVGTGVDRTFGEERRGGLGPEWIRLSGRSELKGRRWREMGRREGELEQRGRGRETKQKCIMGGERRAQGERKPGQEREQISYMRCSRR